MKIIFWNIDKQDLTVELDDLIKSEQPDFLIVCECKIKPFDLLTKFNNPKTLYHYIPTKSTGIEIFTLFSDNFVKVKEDSSRYSILEVNLPLKNKFLLTPIHLPDKGNWNEYSQKYECISIVSSIESIENSTGIRETIVIGDFNMNPFEEGMVSTMGFHAVRDKQIALRKRRKVQTKFYKFFFNPTWKHYENQTNHNAKGTYFYWSAEHICHFWNLFDQVIFRPELISKFDPNEFNIMQKIRHHHLIKGTGRISESYSDHLPISVQFQI